MLNLIKTSARRKPFDINHADSLALDNQALPNMTDSHYFSGHNAQGESFFFRLAKRGDGHTEVWFTLRNSNGKIISNAIELYDTSLCPASVTCEEIGQRIVMSFNGEVAIGSKTENDLVTLDKRIFKIEAKAIFTATMPAFDFSTGLDPHYVAQALAEERWDKAFWRNLRTNHQTHYEQAGQITLEVKMDNQSTTYVFPAMRDHSFGYRDWDYMNRHIWLMVLFDDGEILNLNYVNYPHMHRLLTGYRSANGKHTSLRAASPLNNLGIDGFVPRELCVLVPQANGVAAELYGKRDFVMDFAFADGKYHIFEGVGDYHLGARKGRGIIEFGYNTNATRWK